jgi:subfamily B ATP-binding cassette protein MsbA
MKELLQLLSFARPYLSRLIFSVVLMAVVGACYGLVAILAEPVFDRILDPTSDPGPIPLYEIPFTDYKLFLNDLLPPSVTDIWLIVAFGIIGVFLIKGACNFLGTYLVNYVGLAAVRDLRNDVYGVVLNQSPAFFQKTHTGRLISSLINDIEKIQVALSHILADLLRQGFAVIFLLWVLIQTDWRLAAVSLTVLPFVAVPTMRIGRRIRRTTRSAQDHLARLTQILQETISGNRIVKAFGMERFEMDRFHEVAESVFRDSLRYVRQQGIATPLIELFGAVTIVLLLTYARGQIRAEGMTAGRFTTFIIALLMLYQPVKRLAGIYNIFQQAIGSAQRILEYRDHPHDVPEAPDAVALAPFCDQVEFRDISFRYPETSDLALSGITYTVRCGEVLALVGPSGAGKSTLMNLLPRFFDPSSGEIRIDGHGIRSLQLRSLRDQIAIVTQETFLFDDTVVRNIAYGRPDVSIETVREAARAALADEFIEALPEGYDTHLGERGHRLSGGQRQRIAIARALLKNAPILILDEATSHLDSEAEMLVQRALANLMQDRTVIVSAHRLSTIRSASRILVLDEGAIVDQGTHAELMDRCPLYGRLSKLQSVEQ